jgi:hypothetical protein
MVNDMKFRASTNYSDPIAVEFFVAARLRYSWRRVLENY